MPSLQIGLRLRIRRVAGQIATQHRHLEDLRKEIDSVLGRGARAEAGRSLGQFCTVLAAHFELEENVFFPALHSLEPARERELEALAREHAGFLSELQKLLNGIESARQADSAERFRSCLEQLRNHERIEEELVGAISGRS